MSDAQTASAASPKSAPKKKTTKGSAAKKSKAPSNHPKYVDMAISAIKSLKERNGSSRQAVHKYILSHFNVGTDIKAVNSHLKQALKRGVAGGQLKHVKGQGASGSFKIAEGGAKGKAEKKPKTAKPKASKPKKANPKPKKASGAKKAAKPKKASPKKAAAPSGDAAAKPSAPKKEKKATKKKTPSKPKPKAAKKSPAKKAKSTPKKKAAPKKAKK